MKSKFSRILGVGLVLAVLVSTLVVAPVSAGNLSWTKDSAPTVVSNVDILDLVAAGNGTTGYAVSSENNVVYKTADGGKTWTKTGFAGGQAQKVTVAPDVADGSFLAVIADGNELWVSVNGGTTFTQMTGFTAPTVMRSVAISPAVGTSRSVAFAADNSTWLFTSSADFGAGSVWTNIMASGNVTAGPALAVKFSPNYLQDRTLVVITTTSNTTISNLYNVATSLWNADYTVYQVANLGVVINSTAAATWAVIDLPGSYMAFDSTLRLAYVATNLGLYRNTTQLSTTAMRSVALNAAGDKLVAGASGTNTVYRLATPATATSTTGLGSSSVAKSPGFTGNTMVSVEFFGASVGAATVGGAAADESAFALSGDDGKSFNDVAFVDTVLGAEDFAVNADGSKYYLVTQSGTVASLWRKTTSWERVFKATSATGYLVRPAMDNFDVVYLAECNTANIWYTNDAGQTVWQPRVAYAPIIDFAAESTSVLYVLTGASVSKAVDGGYLWDNPIKVTGAGAGVSMTLLAKDNLLVSGATGVAYTTDGGNNWTSTNLGFAGVVDATADKLSSGGIITAVGGTAVKRFTVGTSTAFSTTGLPTAAYATNGVVINGGVTYAMSSNGTDSSMVRSPITSTAWGTRTLAGTSLTDIKAASGGKLYSLATAGTDAGAIFIFTEVFAAAGPAVNQPAAGYVVPINAETGLAIHTPFQWTAIANSPSSGVTYNLQIALDSAFTQLVLDSTGLTKALYVVGPGAELNFAGQPDVTYYWRVRADGPVDSAWSAAPRSFKVATLAPLAIISPAGGASDVSVKPTFVWSPAAGATTYEIVVSDDPTFKIITFSRTTDRPNFASDEQLAYSTVYYWRVRASAPATSVTPFVNGIFTTEARPVPPTTAPPPVTVTNVTPTVTVSLPPPVEAIPAYLLWIIIGIGAILVIALIVLIVRTRRSS